MTFDLSLSDEQSQLRRHAGDAFAEIRDRRQAVRPSERAAATADDVWNALAKLGFMGFLIPEAYGGSGRGLLAAVLVMEELAAAGLSSFRPILNTMGAAGIARFGVETLKRQMLPRIARGEAVLAIASTEAEAGFNVLNIRTFAERRGDHFVVNGAKVYVSGVDSANFMLLIARTMSVEECRQRCLPRSAGITLFLVDAQAEGIERTALPSRGEPVLTQFALELNDVRVPADRMIGEEHGGGEVMFHLFNPERTLAGAMALGMTRYCLDLACRHARTRKVFADTPIGAYQSVQHPLAAIAVEEEAVRLMVYRSAWLFDSAAGRGEVSESAGSAKLLSSELAVRAVDAAIDTFGGKGFDEDYGVIHLWEAARLLTTAPISNALILNQIAERKLGLPRSY